MRRSRLSWWSVSCLALALAGCPFDFSPDEKELGDSDDAAAAALTEGASFENGELLVGVIPETTNEDLVLAPPPGATDVLPGDDTLLGFEATNPDQSDDAIVATLMQFSGADKYFEVEVNGEEVNGETVSFEHTLKLDDSVCSKLCNRTFDLALEHSAKTKGGAIGKRGMRTLRLDCREKGDSDRCEKKSGADTSSGGNTNGPGGMTVDGMGGSAGVSGPTGTFDAGPAVRPGEEPAFFRSADKLLDLCLSCPDASCMNAAKSYFSFGRQCKVDVMLRYQDTLSDWSTCLDDFYTQQQACADAAMCNAFGTCEFYMTMLSNPHEKACGEAPDAKAQAELDDCDAKAMTMTGGTGAAGSAGGFDAGVGGAGGVGGTGGSCSAPQCNAVSDGSSCMCHATCPTGDYAVMCTDGLCQCMDKGIKKSEFSIVDCNDTPAIDAFMMCGFPVP